MNDVIEYVLLTEEQISEKVRELGAQISRDFEGRRPLVISVLRGSFIFVADLVRQMSIDCSIDFMAVSSYGMKSQTTGAVKIVKDLEINVEGKDVLVVEDILDSGLTLSYIIGMMQAKKPKSLALCTLLNKPSRRKVPVKIDYCGFEIPDEFVVGYGLDYSDRFRNLKYIGVLKPEVYSNE